ncbi:hypothetical protein AALP_AAs65278U000200 [Arabis alpina]|uniref:Bidirectional sugar transporter SWEET n=1 Tax=Arabis alpina TaxID=50452 RepID=A0A087G0S5_ARAAL|nr:hypothetical protein AALP_AAs65278U000200 [Arabis alpina]
MTKAKEIHMIIGIIGTVISSLISLAPMPTFIQVYKKKSMEGDYDPQRHIAMLIKCGLWILYGLPQVQKDNILVTTSNGISFGIELIYLVLYFNYCEDKARRDKNANCIPLGMFIVGFFYVVTLNVCEGDARQISVGVVCTVFTIVMYTWLFRKITMVDKRRFQYMPLGLSFVCFINAAIWTAYSLIYQFDIYVLICNGLGILACAIQFIVNVLHYTPTLNAIDSINVIDV